MLSKKQKLALLCRLIQLQAQVIWVDCQLCWLGIQRRALDLQGHCIRLHHDWRQGRTNP
nr:hypothetical protein [uncultured Roseateles sp.]